MTTSTTAPTVEVSTLIRRPPAEVFAAFADPALTTRCWFTTSSGALAPGATVTWGWEVYGVSDSVRVEEFDAPERFVVRWGSNPDLTTEFRFAPHPAGTVVTITETGVAGTVDEALAYVGDSTGGYTTVVCAAKAVLEHGIELGAIRDKHPDAWV
jgi:uncharacterized protein YndB with AHSA1/START domain